MMELTLLTVPACPNTAIFEERLAAALAGYPDAVVRRREVSDEREAAEAGMHGSPTLLIDAVDPFAAPGQAPSLSCRLYRDAAGHTEGAPPVDALRRVLLQASAGG
jgi:predicted DsbA family dithiol-disulfide isomerase